MWFVDKLWHWRSNSLFAGFAMLIVRNIKFSKTYIEGCGCGSVGRVIASDTRDLQFETSHRQNFILNIFTVNCWNDENKEKSGRDWPLKTLWLYDADDLKYKIRWNVIVFYWNDSSSYSLQSTVFYLSNVDWKERKNKKSPVLAHASKFNKPLRRKFHT